MAASAAEPDHHRTAGDERPHGAKHRQPLLNDLHIQVPAANSGWYGRNSGPATAPCGGANANAHDQGGHGDRPASPSLLRSPSAWIRAKSHNFGSSKHTHRRSGTFQYDARSYAHNFDEGCDDEDVPRHPCFSPRTPTAPQLASASSGLDASGNGKEPAAREMQDARDLE